MNCWLLNWNGSNKPRRCSRSWLSWSSKSRTLSLTMQSFKKNCLLSGQSWTARCGTRRRPRSSQRRPTSWWSHFEGAKMSRRRRTSEKSLEVDRGQSHGSQHFRDVELEECFPPRTKKNGDPIFGETSGLHISTVFTSCLVDSSCLLNMFASRL
eukprot:symbB.v1.2.001112.t1/scaffold46.1/size430244/3